MHRSLNAACHILLVFYADFGLLSMQLTRQSSRASNMTDWDIRRVI